MADRQSRCDMASEWLRSGSPDDARTSVEAHAFGCDACARGLAAERALSAATARLPRNLQPPRDLFPEVARRIRETERRKQRRRLVAAAFGALAAAAAFTLAWRAPPTSPISQTSPRASATASVHVAPRAPEEERYAHEVETLRAELTSLKADDSAKLDGTIEENLAVIDDAIAAVRAALRLHPDDAELHADLERAYLDKVDLLRTATELPQEEEEVGP